jgi:hypothetical protein
MQKETLYKMEIVEAKLPAIVKAIDLSGADEIEYRLGHWRSVSRGGIPRTEFVPGVRRSEFLRLRKFLDEAKIKSSYEHTIDRYLPSGGRLTENVKTKVRYIIEKKKIETFDFQSYGVRLAISEEVKRSVDPKAPLPPESMYREKQRYIYALTESLQLHLTEVTMVEGKQPAEMGESKEEKSVVERKTIWEIELEVKGKENITKGFVLLLLNFYQTSFIYDLTERGRTFFFLNTALQSQKFPQPEEEQQIDTRHLPTIRNLKMEDLVPGGILPQSNSPNYSVTPKADGENAFLVMTKNGCYFAQPPDILRKWSIHKYYEKFGDRLGECVFQGELVPSENVLKGHDKKFEEAKFRFLVFDALILKGKRVSNLLSHYDRLKQGKDLLKFIPPLKGISISVKDMEWFETVPEMRKKISRLLEEKYPYKRDGLIFTPNTKYFFNLDPGRPSSLEERRLYTVPDICKLKPPDLLTIDLRYNIKAGPQGTTRHLYMSGRGGETVFLGSLDHPFSPDQLEKTPSFAPEREFEPRMIYEFAWQPRARRMVALRPRYDKLYPNAREVALDVWRDIHYPLTYEILLGREYGLLDDRLREARKLLLKRIKAYRPNPVVVLMEGNEEDLRTVSPFAQTVYLVSELKSRERGSSESGEKPKVINVASLSDISEMVDAIYVGEQLADISDFPLQAARLLHKGEAKKGGGIITTLGFDLTSFYNYLNREGISYPQEGKEKAIAITIPIGRREISFNPANGRLRISRDRQTTLANLNDIYGSLEDEGIKLVDQGDLVPDNFLTAVEQTVIGWGIWGIAQRD